MSSIQSTTSIYLNPLSVDNIRHIYSFMDPPSVRRMAQTCEEANNDRSDPKIWENLYVHMAPRIDIRNAKLIGTPRVVIERITTAQQLPNQLQLQNWRATYRNDIHKTLSHLQSRTRWNREYYIHTNANEPIKAVTCCVACPLMFISLLTWMATALSSLLFFSSSHILVASYGLAAPIMLPAAIISLICNICSSVMMLCSGSMLSFVTLSGYSLAYWVGNRAVAQHRLLQPDVDTI